MKHFIRCGIDIAKLVFQIHGVNAKSGETAMVKKLARNEVLRYFANKPPMLVGIEAWSKQDNTAEALLALCGVGSVTASAAVDTAGDTAKMSKCGSKTTYCRS